MCISGDTHVQYMQKPPLKRVECVCMLCIGAYGGGKTAFRNRFWEFPMAIQHKPINKTNFKRILHLFCIFVVNYCLFCDCIRFFLFFFGFHVRIFCIQKSMYTCVQWVLQKWWIKADIFEASQYYFNGKVLKGLFIHHITSHNNVYFSLCCASNKFQHFICSYTRLNKIWIFIVKIYKQISICRLCFFYCIFFWNFKYNIDCASFPNLIWMTSIWKRRKRNRSWIKTKQKTIRSLWINV